MQCYKMKWIISFCVLLATSALFAQEKKVVEAVINENHSGKQSLNWEKTQLKLSIIKIRLDTQTALIKKLIADKTRLGGEDLAAKMEELRKEHQRLGKITDEYNQLNLEYLTKFPERGIKEGRVYKRIKPKSLQAYEQAHTVQGQVNKIHDKILRQYSKTSELNKKNNEPKDLRKNAADENIKSGEKTVTDQIIFKK